MLHETKRTTAQTTSVKGGGEKATAGKRNRKPEPAVVRQAGKRRQDRHLRADLNFVKLRNLFPTWMPFVNDVPCALEAKISSDPVAPARILLAVDLPERAGPATARGSNSKSQRGIRRGFAQ